MSIQSISKNYLIKLAAQPCGKRIQASGVTHRYEQTNAQPILNKLALNLAVGETLALVGASGSGKSTLLNLVGGLEPVQDGTVQVFEQALHAANDAARTQLRRTTIGFIYQAFNLIPTLTVLDNVRLPLQHRQLAYPDALSGGEQQRVAIARAVVHQPPLLLADEPTGNLDATTGQQVMQLLHTLVAEHNTTLLLVTHSHQVAKSADRVLTMQDGRLITTNSATNGTTW